MTAKLPIVEAFISYLLDERHFSPYTARCYGVDLRQYTEFISESRNIEVTMDQEREVFETRRKNPIGRKAGDVVATLGPPTITTAILQADVNMLRGFLARLDEHQYSSATMARKIATLRSFCRGVLIRSIGFDATTSIRSSQR